MIRRVSYTLKGTDAPVIHLECRTPEQAKQDYEMSNGCTYEQAVQHYCEALEEFIRNDKPSPRLKIVYSLHDRARMWADAYIQCGSCKHKWNLWYAENPIDNVDEWLLKAKERIRNGSWV